MEVAKSNPGEQGFTLMEVLVALVVASASILAVANLFMYATAQVRAGREDTVSALVAKDKLETLMQVQSNAEELQEGSYLDAPVPGYIREWRIYPNNPAPGARLIVVKARSAYQPSGRAVKFAAIRP